MHLRRTPLLVAAALLAATILVPLAPRSAAAAATYAANCPANLRSSPASDSSLVGTIQTGSAVVASGTVQGGAWAASCPGSVSGSTWLAITAVNGRSVSSLYGVGTAYAASGLFRAGGYLEGVDVSTYQGSVNWAAVAAAGKRFAIMRSSLGSTYRDPTYATNHSGARAAGMAVAAYHYATPSTASGDPVNEAKWFVQNASLAIGDVVPALDIEQSGGLGVSALQAWVQAWLDTVYSLTGLRPMIYTSPSFWQSGLGNTAQFANEGYSILWVAHWGATSPIVPAGNWGGRGWTFWQYDNCGRVSGISGCVDLDRYNGLDISPVTIAALGTPTGVPAPGPALPPVLSSIAPSTTAAGGGNLSLAVTGSNFVAGSSTVYWDGSPLATSYVSASRLAATVPAVLTTTPAVSTVTVVDRQTGTTSGGATFTVMQATANLTVGATPSTIVVGQGATVTVAISPSGAGRTVTLESVGAGDAGWTTVGSAAADATGTPRFPIAPRVNTQYRAVFAGAPDLAAATSQAIRVLVRSALTLSPTNGGRVVSLTYGTKRTFTATATPVGTGIAAQKVSFSFYRYIGGRWVFLTKRDAYVDASGRARYTWAFTWRGQWYVRAAANSTTTNANSLPTRVERYSIR